MERPLKDLKILIVDDELEILDVMALTLEHYGAEVLQANSGSSAEKLLRQTSVDVIISDIRMPDGDGVQLLQSVRKVDPKHPPFFFVSGFAEVTTEEAKRLGAQGRFFKPISVKDIADEIRSLLKA